MPERIWKRRFRAARRLTKRVLRRLLVPISAGCTLIAATSAHSGLVVYEPFDFPGGTILDGTPANGLGLSGTYTPLGTIFAQKLDVADPGLDYGNLAGTYPAIGGRLNDSAGVTAGGATVSLAQALGIVPGGALYWSALFTLDDSLNGNHLANITLRDDTNGDFLVFGEPSVGIGGLRVAASTQSLGGLQADGADGVFTDGATILLIGRYLESATPGGDLLQLLAYDTAASTTLPTTFDPTDPRALTAFTLSGLDIDFGQITSIDFTIRGTDNNFIDELRVGDDYASVVPEPGGAILLALGLALLASQRTS